MAAKKNRRQINVADERAKMLEEDGIDLTLPDGSVIAAPPPVLWPVPKEDETTDDFGARILGADEWKRWMDAGEDFATFNEYVKRALGAPVGE